MKPPFKISLPMLNPYQLLSVCALSVVFAASPTRLPAAVEVVKADLTKGQSTVVFSATVESTASTVHVAGSFNGWSRQETPLTRVSAQSNTWVTTKTLEDGSYQYKFVVNGDQWRTDTDNLKRASDGHEGSNSILNIGPGEELGPSQAQQQDGSIELAALLHRPNLIHFANEMAVPGTKSGEYTTVVVLRLRTRANDINRVSLRLLGSTLIGGNEDNQPDDKPTTISLLYEMGDERFTWWFAQVPAPPKGKPLLYDFYLDDALPTWKTHFTTESPKPGFAGPQFSLQASFVPGRIAQAPDFRPFVWKPGTSPLFTTPQWARDAIYYQIMPERFRNGLADNDPTGTLKWTRKWSEPTADEKTSGTYPAIFDRRYGGDLQGVTDKLDYIKSTGANAIYFNPVFEATSLHKYDATDYRHIDQALGAGGRDYPSTAAKEDLLDSKTWIFSKSDQVFLNLLKEAKKREIRVIVDGVFNHVGKSHPAFQDLFVNGRQSRFANWFDVTDWNKPWDFEKTPFTYNGWGGFGGLPNFKENAQGFADRGVRDHLFAITRRWMDPNGDGDPSDGIDGWRLDVPDEVTPHFWREWRRLVKSINPEAVIIGEIWGDPSKWLRGDQFDSVMNYEFHAKPQYEFWSGAKKASALAGELRRYGNLIPAQSAQVMMNILDSHDTDRWFSMLENPGRPYDGQNRPQDGVKNYKETKPNERAYRRGLAAVTLQYALPGAPNIWYGTEQGMWGADDPHDRKPMWWDDKPNDDAEERPIVAVNAHYQAMAAIRKANPVLSRGSLWVLGSDDTSNTVYFRRDYRDETALIGVNGSDQEQTVVFYANNAAEAKASWMLVHGGTAWPKPSANRKAPAQLQAQNGKIEVKVPAGDCVILIRQQ